MVKLIFFPKDYDYADITKTWTNMNKFFFFGRLFLLLFSIYTTIECVILFGWYDFIRLLSDWGILLTIISSFFSMLAYLDDYLSSKNHKSNSTIKLLEFSKQIHRNEKAPLDSWSSTEELNKMRVPQALTSFTPDDSISSTIGSSKPTPPCTVNRSPCNAHKSERSFIFHRLNLIFFEIVWSVSILISLIGALYLIAFMDKFSHQTVRKWYVGIILHVVPGLYLLFEIFFNLISFVKTHVLFVYALLLVYVFMDFVFYFYYGFSYEFLTYDNYLTPLTFFIAAFAVLISFFGAFWIQKWKKSKVRHYRQHKMQLDL
jgi:hypothetical protein